MKAKSIFAIIALCAVALSSTSCGNQKQVMNAGKQEIFIPFNTPEFRSDMDYFRATASGTSPDMEMARNIADLNARNLLGAQVSSVVKAVTERYSKQLNVANKADFQQKVEQNVRLVVNQTLDGAVVKDSKLYQNTDGTYEYWVNIEMPKVKVIEEVAESITKDESLEVDFNQHLFRKVFDEEMALEMQRQAQGK